MADWYVFQHDGEYLGPWSTEVVAQSISAGKLSPEVWVAAPGGPGWVRALDVPAIADLLEGAPTRPKRRDSGLRLMPGAFTLTPSGRPAFGATAMMAPADVVDDAAQTTKMLAVRVDDDDAPTDPSMPPHTPTPTPTGAGPRPAVGAGPTLESPGNVRRRKARA